MSNNANSTSPTVFTSPARERLSRWVYEWVLKEEAQILRNTPTTTPSGGRKDSWSILEETRATALDAGSPAQQLVAAREVGYMTKIILLPLGTDIRRDDRIQMGSLLYHVLDLFDVGTFEVTQRVSVRRASIQGGV